MTDTGNFAFSFLTPDLMRSVAVLLERGLEIPKVYNAVYNSYSASRVKLLGYSLGKKMEVLAKGKAACISLTEKEMRRYNFQLGDSEGFVNYPLTIAGMKMSALFIETRKFVRGSLRSRGDEVDVNIFARRYFGGGGHKNAAGGKSFVSMEQTIKHFEAAIKEFAKEGLL
jgi:phosphoesterase RecJ-like protein